MRVSCILVCADLARAGSAPCRLGLRTALETLESSRRQKLLILACSGTRAGARVCAVECAVKPSRCTRWSASTARATRSGADGGCVAERDADIEELTSYMAAQRSKQHQRLTRLRGQILLELIQATTTSQLGSFSLVHTAAMPSAAPEQSSTRKFRCTVLISGSGESPVLVPPSPSFPPPSSPSARNATATSWMERGTARSCLRGLCVWADRLADLVSPTPSSAAPA